jgi:hypothetical protein
MCVLDGDPDYRGFHQAVGNNDVYRFVSFRRFGCRVPGRQGNILKDKKKQGGNAAKDNPW